MRRRVYKDKAKVETFESLTSSGTWTAPSGCNKVDIFLCGAGYNGASANWNYAGKGGNGGYIYNAYNIPVTPGNCYSFVVGSSNGSHSTFTIDSVTYSSNSGSSKSGGTAAQNVAGYAYNGGAGKDGVYPFDNLYPNDFYLYGASGGGGAAENATGKKTGYGGSGGNYKAGEGGDSPSENLSHSSSVFNGTSAQFYGAGGGGGGKWTGQTNYSTGGSGYQGVIILHYYK